MRAKAIVCDDGRDVELADVELPEPGPDDVVVDTRFSGVSIGTELNLIRQNVSWVPFPLSLGYQAVGEVTEVGANVSQYAVGDDVYYVDNSSSTLPDGETVSEAHGTHCSAAVIDPEESSGIGRLPTGSDVDVASTFVMPAVGLNGVTMANVQAGDTVVVHGTGLIGLGVVGACQHRGAEIVAVDVQADRLRVAERLGADYVIDASTSDVEAAVEEIFPGGADVVFEATGVPDCVDVALPLCASQGTFVFQGDYGKGQLSFSFHAAHLNQITAFFPCGDGGRPCREAVLENMASGALPWSEVITDRVDAADARTFYDRLKRGDTDGVLGAVIDWT